MMKMKTTLAILAVMVMTWCARGDATLGNATLGNAVIGGGSVVDTYAATNTPGYPLLAYWPATTYSAGTLVDHWTNAWNLTNTSASNVPLTNSLDGLTVAQFDSGRWLRNINFTNYSEPYEIMMLARPIWGTAIECRFTDSPNGSLLIRQNTTTGVWLFRGTTSASLVPTNAWIVFSFQNASATAGTIYTNMVVQHTTSAGSAMNANGISVGGRYSDGAAPAYMLVAEIAVWRTNLTASVRTNVYDSWKLKYPSAGLP
jgi:hypothetical protein